MSCAAERAVASSLPELRGHSGADGVVRLSDEVEADFRHAYPKKVCESSGVVFLFPVSDVIGKMTGFKVQAPWFKPTPLSFGGV